MPVDWESIVRKLAGQGDDWFTRAWNFCADIGGEIRDWVHGELDGAAGRFEGIDIATFVRDALANVTTWVRPGHVSPDDALGNMGKALGFASATGITAHVASIAAEAVSLGQLDMTLTGATAFLGKIAGFDPIVSNSLGQFYRAWLGVPMQYYANSLTTPVIPGPMEVMRFRYKRILPGSVHPHGGRPSPLPQTPGSPLPGFDELKKLLAYHGLSEEWAKVYEDDLYTEPRHFELGIMGESDKPSEDWWWEKCRRMGYTEIDAGYMVDGMRKKLARSWINRVLGEWIYMYSQGFLSEEDFGLKLDQMDLSPAYEYLVRDSAQWRGQRYFLQGELRLAEDQYRRTLITEDELEHRVRTVIKDAEIAEQQLARIRTRRYRSVTKITPAGEALREVSRYRRLLIQGVVPWPAYEATLSALGVESDVIATMKTLDTHERRQEIVADFRKYDLPAWRDALAAGELTADQYAGMLRNVGFPEQVIPSEVRLAGYLAERARAQRVRSEVLPAYERAYVLGLIGADLAGFVMREAGRSEAGVNARMRLLTYERNALASKRAQQAYKAREALREEAEREAERLERELDRERAAARGVSEEWLAIKGEEAAAASADEAEVLLGMLAAGPGAAALDELRKGADAEPDTVARVRDYARSLSDATERLADSLFWANLAASA